MLTASAVANSSTHLPFILKFVNSLYIRNIWNRYNTWDRSENECSGWLTYSNLPSAKMMYVIWSQVFTGDTFKMAGGKCYILHLSTWTQSSDMGRVLNLHVLAFWWAYNLPLSRWNISSIIAIIFSEIIDKSWLLFIVIFFFYPCYVACRLIIRTCTLHRCLSQLPVAFTHRLVCTLCQRHIWIQLCYKWTFLSWKSGFQINNVFFSFCCLVTFRLKSRCAVLTL